MSLQKQHHLKQQPQRQQLRYSQLQWSQRTTGKNGRVLAPALTPTPNATGLSLQQLQHRQQLQPQEQGCISKRQTSPSPRSPWPRPVPLNDPDPAVMRPLPARLQPLGLEQLRHHQQRHHNSRQRRQAQPVEDSNTDTPEVANVLEAVAVSNASKMSMDSARCELVGTALQRPPSSRTPSSVASNFEGVFSPVSEFATSGPEDPKKEPEREGKKGQKSDPFTIGKEWPADDTNHKTCLVIREGVLSSQSWPKKCHRQPPVSPLLCTKTSLSIGHAMPGMAQISELQFHNGLMSMSEHRRVLLQRGYARARLAATGQSPIVKELSESFDAFSRRVFAGTPPPAEKLDQCKSLMETVYFENSTVEMAASKEDGNSMASEEASPLLADLDDDVLTRPAAKQPRHIRVSGMPISMANGIYTLQVTEIAATYHSTPLFLRHGTKLGLWWAKADSLRIGVERRSSSGMDSLASLPVSTPSRPTSRASWRPSSRSCCSPSPLEEEAINGCNSQSPISKCEDGAAAAQGRLIGRECEWSTFPWSAWVIGIPGDDGTLLARSQLIGAGDKAAPDPGTVRCWERFCDRHEHSGSEGSGDVCSAGTSLGPQAVWLAAEEVEVEVLAPPPEFIYFLDEAGHLNGTYMLAEDIDGRTSYAREDGAVSVSWNCEDGRWTVKVAARASLDLDTDADQTSNSVVEATARSLTGDVPDPSQAAGWQRWGKASGEWKLDEGIFVLPGRMPPAQLFITGCSSRVANGIYDLFNGVHEGRPFYEQTGVHQVQHHVLLWSESRSTWLLRAKGTGKEVAWGTRKSSNVQDGDSDCATSQHPDGPWNWQDHCDAEAEAACETEAVGMVKQNKLRHFLAGGMSVDDDLVEGGASGAAESECGCSMHVTAVQPSPERLFLDISDLSQLSVARGVYEFVADKQEPRGCFQRCLGGWRLFWAPTQGAWHLAMYDSDVVRARAVYDAPDPTRIPWDCHWQVPKDAKEYPNLNRKTTSNSPAAPLLCVQEEVVKVQEDHLSSEILPVWHDDTHIVVQPVEIPPRRVSVSGNKRFHPLYGLYFLREIKNGRPSYGKEPVEGQHFDRGHVLWGSSQAAWRIVAQVKKGECWHGLLKDDLPNPSMITTVSWEVETLPNNNLSKSRREQAEEEEADALANRLRRSEESALGRLLASMEEPVKEEPTKESVQNVIPLKNDDDLGLTCLPVDDAAPNAVFVTGHSAKLDGVFFLQDALENGRPRYQNQLHDLRWIRTEQRWSFKARDGSAGELSLPCDTPDPSATPHSSWQEDREAACIASSERTSKEGGEELEEKSQQPCSQPGPGGEEPPPVERRNRRLSTNRFLESLDKSMNTWLNTPNLRCFVVPPPPSEIVVTGPVCERCDFTGVYMRVEFASDCWHPQQRPFYKMLNTSKAACCSIRYLPSERRWLIEWVPELKGRVAGFRIDLNSCTFAVASVAYDAPHPGLVPVPWSLRRNNEWILPDVPIACRTVSSAVAKLLVSDI